MPPPICYEYRRANGTLAFVKRRHPPKGFSYHAPDGHALDDTSLPKLLYRLPELIRADPTATIFIAEGEKDCDALAALGLVATCNYDGGGRGKWRTSYNRYFRDRAVVILPDNDRTGDEHTTDIAGSLAGVARSVKIVNLPNLPHKGDVSDWLGAGGTVQGLAGLSRAAPQWRPTIELKRPDDRYDESILRENVERILGTDLKPQEKLLLIVLKGQIARPKPTQHTIARAMSLSPRHVKKMLANLRRRGFVEPRKRGRENTYHVRTILRGHG